MICALERERTESPLVVVEGKDMPRRYMPFHLHSL